jgi:hypothetical protein
MRILVSESISYHASPNVHTFERRRVKQGDVQFCIVIR